MNRRDPLILVAEPQLVSSGLWPDRHPIQTPLWEVANNVQFAGGKVQRRVPNALILTDAGGNRLGGIGQMQASNGVRWVWFSARGKIYRWYGPPAELIYDWSPYTDDQTSVAEPTFFDFNSWGNWMIVNAADHGTRIFKPGTPDTFNVLLNAPQDAVQYFKKRNQLIAVGHGVNRRLISFSDADAIEVWLATATNLAGEIPLEELNTPVKAGCHFGPSIAVFGENQMFEFKWIGAPFYYGQNKLLDGIGCTGKMAVCSDGRVVYGVSRNGCWKTDGLQYSYIDEVILRDYLQDNVNWAQSGKIVVQKNDVTGCIEFSFPMHGSVENNEAWAYDPRYGGWSLVPSFRVMAPRVLLDKPLQGQIDGRLELVASNSALQGDLLLETKPMLMQQDNNALHLGSLIDEVELFIHNTSGVEFQYGVAEFPDGPFEWCNPIEVKKEQITYQPDTKVSGVYHKLRFTNFNLDWALDLQGFALFGVPEGMKREKA